MKKVKICAAVLSTLLVTTFFGGINLNATESRVRRQEKFEKRLQQTSFLGSIDFYAEDQYADYDEIVFTSCVGDKVRVYVEGDNVGIETVSGSMDECTLGLFTASGSQLKVVYGDDSAEIDASDLTDTNDFYEIAIYLTFDSQEIYNDSMYFTKDNDGNMRFLKAPFYDFNVAAFEELTSDPQFLEECLMPANDIQCDNPDVILTAQEACAGCTTDYEKAFAIYTWITENMYYNLDEVYYGNRSFQDDSLTLIRKKLGVCEGFGNMFSAMCRAVGVPASVTFGVGFDTAEVWDDSIYNYSWSNHAWAVAYVGGEWYSVDPTWDNFKTYSDGEYSDGETSTDWFLVPLETFSLTHSVWDADTMHAKVSTGSCGPNATYEITPDGVCTVYGSGILDFSEADQSFKTIVFDPSSNITEIGEDCFLDNDLITTIILPDTVTKISDYAFQTCEDLHYVYIPDGVTIIGNEAFESCDELAYLYVPDSVVSIGNYAFDLCPRLIVSVPGNSDLQTYNYDVEPLRVIER